MGLFRSLMMASTLPYKRRLSWLRSTGTQYIDTGITPNQDTVFEFTYRATTIPSTYSSFLGSAGNNSIYLAYFNSTPVVYMPNASASYSADTNQHTLRVANRAVTLDGVNVPISGTNPATWSNVNSMYIFAAHNNSGAAGFSSFDAMALKIWQGNVLVRDLIPVLDNSNTACMYDKVTGQFFYNMGTGEFIPSTYPVDDPLSMYASNGLVAMLDAIKNTASGHDSSATTWKDLQGGYDIPIDLAKASWGYNSCAQTQDFLNTAKSTDKITSHTITYECVFTPTTSNNYAWVSSMRDSETGTTQCLQFNKRGTSTLYYMFNGGSAAAFYNSGISTSRYASISFDGENVNIYENGVPRVTKAYSTVYDFDNHLQLFSFGNIYSYAGTIINAVRVYNRALTAQEIMQNYLVDKRRFNLQ